MRERQDESEQRVTPLELFFDLVFVFAITQVTGFLADNSTWDGLLRGLFLLGVVWWAWAAYAWLTNTLNPEEGLVRIAVFASVGAMLIVALATPNAFAADGVRGGRYRHRRSVGPRPPPPSRNHRERGARRSGALPGHKQDAADGAHRRGAACGCGSPPVRPADGDLGRRAGDRLPLAPCH